MSTDDMVSKRTAGLTAASRSLFDGLYEAMKHRKQANAKELEHELSRYQRTMLRDGVYSRQEAETLLSSFFTALQGTIQKELRSQTNLSAEFFAQLFACASAKGLSLEPPRIPGAVTGSTPAFLQKNELMPAKKLASLDSPTSGDAKLNQEIREVEKQNARQQEKLERITSQFQQMMQAKAEVGAQLAEARAEIKALQDKHGAGKPEEIASLQAELDKLKLENEKAKRALAAKLGESPQFGNLKKMIAKKNQELASLRERLQKHELVYADDEDDPDF